MCVHNHSLTIIWSTNISLRLYWFPSWRLEIVLLFVVCWKMCLITLPHQSSALLEILFLFPPFPVECVSAVLHPRPWLSCWQLLAQLSPLFSFLWPRSRRQSCCFYAAAHNTVFLYYYCLFLLWYHRAYFIDCFPYTGSLNFFPTQHCAWFLSPLLPVYHEGGEQSSAFYLAVTAASPGLSLSRKECTLPPSCVSLFVPELGRIF